MLFNLFKVSVILVSLLSIIPVKIWASDTEKSTSELEDIKEKRVVLPIKLVESEIEISEKKKASPYSTEVEELISRDNFDEIDQKILGLLTKDLAFADQEDITKIIYLNDYLVNKSHKGAIRRKILWLTKGKILERSIPSFTGYSIKHYGGYLDRVMNDPSLRHTREPSWVFSDRSPPHEQDLEAAKKLEELLDQLQ